MTAEPGKPYEEWTFGEIVEYASQRIHGALLESGGRGLKTEVHVQLSGVLRWKEAGDKRQSQKKGS